MSIDTLSPTVMPDMFFEQMFNEIPVTPNSLRHAFMNESLSEGQAIKASEMFEQACDTIARELCDDYDGGAWSYLRTKGDSGMFIMMPNEETRNFVCNGADKTKCVMDNRTFGMCVAFYAYSRLANKMPYENPEIAEVMADNYYNLIQNFYGLAHRLSFTDCEGRKPSEHHDLVKPMSDAVWSIAKGVWWQ